MSKDGADNNHAHIVLPLVKSLKSGKEKFTNDYLYLSFHQYFLYNIFYTIFFFTSFIVLSSVVNDFRYLQFISYHLLSVQKAIKVSHSYPLY